MKILRFLAIFSLIFTVACSKEEDKTSPSKNNYSNPVSCEKLPQFIDQAHEMTFSSIGSSCLTNDYYNNIQVGSATLVYSDGSENCSSPTAFYIFHMGAAVVNNEEKTFDINIYILGSQKPQVNDQIDLSDSTINVFYSYTDGGMIKSAKAISGSIELSSTSESADLFGEFHFTAVEFNVINEFDIDRYVLGKGDFVQGGDRIKVAGKFLAQDHGLSPDCQ